MKHYAEELLQEEVSATQKELLGASTRLDWSLGFYEEFVVAPFMIQPRHWGFV